MKALKLGLVAALALPSAALAQAPASEEARLEPVWQKLDANKDGKVMLDELPPPMAGAMRRSDLNGDGAITVAEYVAFDHDPGGSARTPLSDNVRFVPELNYAGTSDWRQTLDVYLPKKAAVPGPLPVVVFVHGGGWTTGSKHMNRSQAIALAQGGRYAAVSINYRLAWQSRWPAQINDVKAAVRWVRGNAARYGLDPKRICASGASAGGHLVGLLGTSGGIAAVEGRLGTHLRQSSRVQCVIDIMGPADLANLDRASGPASPINLMLGGSASEKPDVARQASPVSFVDRSDPPFLLIHGTADPVVSYQESVKFDAALRGAGVPVLFQTVEGGGHGDFGAALPQVFERQRLFLERVFYDPAIVVPIDPLKK